MGRLGELKNLDLLSVGISIAGILILGFVIFYNNRKSVTTRTFLIFSLFATLWSISNYMIYQFHAHALILFITRIHMFFAVWYAFFIFQLFYVFPDEKKIFSHFFKFFIVPVTLIVAALTLSPLVLSRVANTPVGEVAIIRPGPGIVPFGILVGSLIMGGIVILIRKLRKVSREEKMRFRLILVGVATTFGLHLTFNFIFPIIFANPRLVPLGAVFTFPMVAFTFYAIVKHELFNIKIVATEILTFVLAIVSLIEVILSENTVTLIFRSGVFILVLTFGILLIKSVLREIKLREEIEKLSAMKSQFLSFASHQVKSPMTVVKDYADLIADGSFGEVPDKVKETARKIHDSADRLIALVNNLLDLRKLEEGKIEYKFAEMDLNALVKSIVEEMKTLADAKGLALSLEAPQGEIKIKADSEKIRQVIQNLIDNSVKYTEHGYIHVKIQSSNDKCQITVSDSGIGIPPELIPKLFEQFNRGSQEAKKIQGTGLGLYIAKQFMEAHHGRVWAESAGPGKGSTFIVEMGVL